MNKIAGLSNLYIFSTRIRRVGIIHIAGVQEPGIGKVAVDDRILEGVRGGFGSDGRALLAAASQQNQNGQQKDLEEACPRQVFSHRRNLPTLKQRLHLISPLESSASDALYNEALQGHVENQYRDSHNHGTRHHQPILRSISSLQRAQSQRKRL